MAPSTSTRRGDLVFTAADAQAAHQDWGANCGPGALAAIAGRTLTDVRAHIPDFDRRRYTNPTMMRAALESLGLTSHWTRNEDPRRSRWPAYGLARVQWCGPWTRVGVPPAAAYRHTHWVGARRADPKAPLWVFDINCISVGGWVPLPEWTSAVVPWLLRQVEPEASGDWFLTHTVTVL